MIEPARAELSVQDRSLTCDMVASAPRAIMGGCIGARLAGSVVLGLTLIACVFTFLYEEKRITMEVHVSSSSSVYPAATLASARVQSARLCNRIDLPRQWLNETQGPYNPAAIRHPKTGEWLLFFRIEEVRALPCVSSMH